MLWKALILGKVGPSTARTVASHWPIISTPYVKWVYYKKALNSRFIPSLYWFVFHTPLLANRIMDIIRFNLIPTWTYIPWTSMIPTMSAYGQLVMMKKSVIFGMALYSYLMYPGVPRVVLIIQPSYIIYRYLVRYTLGPLTWPHCILPETSVTCRRVAAIYPPPSVRTN